MMAESFYNASHPTPPPQSPLSPTGPPPPPPPKTASHHPSRTNTPSSFPPQHSYSQSYSQPPPPSSVPPLVPPTPTHTQALALQQQQQQQLRQQQQTPSQAQYSHSQPQQYSQPHNNAIAPPPIDSGWLPDSLKEKSTADLQPLINNPTLLTAFAHQHPSYAASLEPLQDAVMANLSLAQQVSQLETQVKQLRDQTAQLLLNHTSLQTQWRRKQGEMDEALAPWGPRAMYQKLVSSINEQESLLRAVHESFLEGGGDLGDDYGGGHGKATEKEVTEWIKRIREGTTVLEKRREMRARWDEGRVGGWR